MGLVCETSRRGSLGRWDSLRKQLAGVSESQPHEVGVRGGVQCTLEVSQQRELVHARLEGDRVEGRAATKVSFEVVNGRSEDGSLSAARDPRSGGGRCAVYRRSYQSSHKLVRVQLGLRFRQRTEIADEGSHCTGLDESHRCREGPVRQ